MQLAQVKRLIWIKKNKLFKDVVLPLLNDYAKLPMFELVATDPAPNAVTLTHRRQQPIVTKLARMIGESLELYNVALQHVRMQFIKTGSRCFCTLRTDLVMALVDAGASKVRLWKGLATWFNASCYYRCTRRTRVTSLLGV